MNSKSSFQLLSVNYEECLRGSQHIEYHQHLSNLLMQDHCVNHSLTIPILNSSLNFERVLMHNIAFYSWLKNTKTHRNKKRHLDSSFCVAKHIWSVTSSHKTHEEFSLYTLKTLLSIFLINILLNLAANIMGKVQINWTNLAHQIYTRIAKNQVKENHDKLQLKY